MARWLPCLFLAATTAALGCSAEATDDGSATTEDGVRDAQGNEIVTATVDTFLKTSTQDSSTLPASDVCRIPKGSQVKLGAPTTLGAHVRGRLASAHGCGGKFGGGATVYVFRQHFSGWSAAPQPTPDPTGPTCSPARARGIVPTMQKALLDTIAFAEGTKGRGQDGYNVQFTYVYFDDCTRHPRRIQSSGGLRSDASGRYQFLSTTWDTLGYATFYPDNQERGAMALVRRRGGSVPESRAMTATELANLMDRISYEWASLPPGRYGQPNYSQARIRSEYCRSAGC
ncbi:MAG: glycoside hydrolase family 104 protein [Myxococcales bacterium]|nr:glycoside hydrolase family 104 protein [Myxococcales bacterium]